MKNTKQLKHAAKKNTDLDNISGDYQYKALYQSNPAQEQWHKNRLNLIKYLNFLNKKDEVLDAGCGSGNVILEFYQDVKIFVGIDNNKKCISFLNQKIEEKKIKNAKAIEMDLLKIELNRKFTKVILCEVVEHFNEDDVLLLLAEIKKTLSSGGKVLITTPNYHSTWMVLEEMIDHLGLSPKLWGEQHLIKFTPKKLKELVKKSGFEIEKQGTLNTFSPFLSFINKKFADKLSFWEFSHTNFGNLLYIVAKTK